MDTNPPSPTPAAPPAPPASSAPPAPSAPAAGEDKTVAIIAYLTLFGFMLPSSSTATRKRPSAPITCARRWGCCWAASPCR